MYSSLQKIYNWRRIEKLLNGVICQYNTVQIVPSKCADNYAVKKMKIPSPVPAKEQDLFNKIPHSTVFF